MDKIRQYLTNAAFGVGCLIILGFGISSSGSAPRHAFVAVDTSSKTYFGPNCMSVVPPGWMADGHSLGTLSDLEAAGYVMATLETVRDARFGPDPDCRDSGEFISEGRSLTGDLLEAIGILGPIPPRWNADGTWNY